MGLGLGICKVGGDGSGSNSSPWILCFEVRTISLYPLKLIFDHQNYIPIISYLN